VSVPRRKIRLIESNAKCFEPERMLEGQQFTKLSRK
jgi:hypothetical protein